MIIKVLLFIYVLQEIYKQRCTLINFKFKNNCVYKTEKLQ